MNKTLQAILIILVIVAILLLVSKKKVYAEEIVKEKEPEKPKSIIDEVIDQQKAKKRYRIVHQEVQKGGFGGVFLTAPEYYFSEMLPSQYNLIPEELKQFYEFKRYEYQPPMPPAFGGRMQIQVMPPVIITEYYKLKEPYYSEIVSKGEITIEV